MPPKEASGSDHQIQLTQFLSHQHLCDSLTVAEIHNLLDYLTLMDLKKGDILSDIGDVGDSLYFVVKGEIAVTFDERGEEREIVRAGSGGLVGVMSFFDKQPRSVRLVTKAPKTQVLKLSRAMYKRMKVEHPYIAINIVEQAIISLDNLFRRVSSDFAQFSHYLYGAGYK